MVTSSVAEARVFRAVADPTRRAILARLREGRLSVQDVARNFRMSRPAISRHLRVLRSAELVSEEREGSFRLYQLNPERIRLIEDWVEQFRPMWAHTLLQLKSHVERRARQPKD
jgi:DNA-binding transcriptional ArsR family regulator